MYSNLWNNSRKSYIIHTDSRGPWSMGTDPSARREQRTALTGENSSTVRSPAVRSSPLDSPQPRASNGRTSWTGGSLEQARRWPWRMTKVNGSMPAISEYGTLRRIELFLWTILYAWAWIKISWMHIWWYV